MLGVVLAFVSPSALAQDPTPSPAEQQLQRTIEELQRRLAELERAVGPARPDSVTPLAPPPPDPSTLRVYWREGLRMDSADRSLQFQIGGRIMNDWAFSAGDAPLESRVGSFEDGTEFRRARLFVSGVLYGRMDFKAQYDFAGGSANFKDVYVGFRRLPALGNLRVGHFKEGFSLEEITSSKYITFMERASISAFTPSRNTGIAIFRDALDERLTWNVGIFRDADTFGASQGEGGYAVTGRLTGLPWRPNPDGARLLHLGAAASYRDALGNVVRFSERPEAHLAPRVVDTGVRAARAVILLGVEAALVNGPVSLQGEVVRTDVHRPSGPRATLWGGYIEASYFLTGEHRQYDGEEAAFDRVRPRADVFSSPGARGAWELAVRYSRLDLDDGDIQGGQVDAVTAGVNWHLNPNTRVMWNLVRPRLARVGDATIVQARMQIDF